MGKLNREVEREERQNVCYMTFTNSTKEGRERLLKYDSEISRLDGI